MRRTGRRGRPAGRRSMAGRGNLGIDPDIGRETESVNEPQEEVPQNPPVPESREEMIARIARMLADLVPQSGTAVPPPIPTPAPVPGYAPVPIPVVVPEREVTIQQVRKMGAQQFDGDSEPEVALDWLRDMDRIFELTRCPDDQRLRLGAFCLTGMARDWWESVPRRTAGAGLWDDFKFRFTEHFYPSSYRNAKISELYRLEQGSMSVAEYQRKFNQLSRAAPELLGNELERCRMFSEGLRDEIGIPLASAEHHSYGSMVEAAFRIERKANRSRSAYQGKQKRSSGSDWSEGGSSSKSSKSSSSSGPSGSFRLSSGAGSSQGSVRPPSGQRDVSDSRGSIPQCRTCGRNHRGECFFRRTSGCFHCGQEGHIKKNCPLLAPTQMDDIRSVPLATQGREPPIPSRSGVPSGSSQVRDHQGKPSVQTRGQQGRPPTQTRSQQGRPMVQPRVFNAFAAALDDLSADVAGI